MKTECLSNEYKNVSITFVKENFKLIDKIIQPFIKEVGWTFISFRIEKNHLIIEAHGPYTGQPTYYLYVLEGSPKGWYYRSSYQTLKLAREKIDAY